MTKKTVSPTDSELFRQTIGDVRAVTSDKVPLKQGAAKPYPKAKNHDLDDAWQPATYLDIENVSLEETLSFAAPGIQNSVLAKLRKGFFGGASRTGFAWA